MNRTWLILAVVLLILVVAGLVVALVLSPRLVQVTPEPGAENVPAAASLRLEFSRQMQPESVISRLQIEPDQQGEFSWDGNVLLFTPKISWTGGQTIRVRLAPGSESADFPVLAMNGEVSWTFNVAKPALLYLFPMNAPANLYILFPESDESQPLLETTGEVLGYSVTRNGTQIYYSTSQPGGGSAIYRFDRLSGEHTRLISFSHALLRYPQVSPAGDFLAYEYNKLIQGQAQSLSQVWLLKLDSQAEFIPFQVGDLGHQSEHPHWSPGGMLTFYDRTQEAFIVYNVETEDRLQISSQTGIPGVWDVQGESYLFPEILFNITNEIGDAAGLSPIPASHLLRFRLADQQLEDLSKLDNLEDTAPSISPDGKTILFARKSLNVDQWMPGRQIWMMGINGEYARQISDEANYNYYGFTWSPDGSKVAYLRFNQIILTEPTELWMMDADGGNSRLLVKGGYEPLWIP